MKNNYLLIDYENVQPRNLALLNGVKFRVMVFLGANQSKLPYEFASEMQKLGSDSEYVKISGNGSNALDFHIAFTIGQISKTDPDAYFHIISKDTGFDPLIQYAKKQDIRIHRSKDIASIPILKLSNAKTNAEKVESIVRNLIGRGAARPRKRETLMNTINSLFMKELSEKELRSLVQSLESRGYVSINEGYVSYQLKG